MSNVEDDIFLRAGPPPSCGDSRFPKADPPTEDPLACRDPNETIEEVIDREASKLYGNPIETCPQDPISQDETGLIDVGNDTDSGSPDGVQPFVLNIREISDLCKRGLTTAQMNGVIVQLLINYFKDPENYMNDEVKHLRWSDNSKENTLRITMIYRWDVLTAEHLPAIVIKRGSMQFQRLAIGDADIHCGTFDSYTRKMIGSYIIYAMGGTDAESELLGYEVANFFQCFSPAIRSRTPIFNLEVDQIGELAPIKELGNKFAVPISLHYEKPVTWIVNELAPILKSITLKV